MLKIFKEHMNNMCVLDDFDFYEKRQNLMQETRTKQQLLRKQASLLFLKRFLTPSLLTDGSVSGVVGWENFSCPCGG